MATLILHNDEKLEDLINDDVGYNAIPLFNIEVIIHDVGKEKTILKSASVDLKI